MTVLEDDSSPAGVSLSQEAPWRALVDLGTQLSNNTGKLNTGCQGERESDDDNSHQLPYR